MFHVILDQEDIKDIMHRLRNRMMIDAYLFDQP